MKKFYKKFICVSLLVGGLNFLPSDYNFPTINSVQAEVKMYLGVGEDYASQIESQEVAKLRARDKAIKKAVEQAGVILKSYTRTNNFILTDDEINTIASNTYEIIGEPTYQRTVKQLTDEVSVIVWQATVNVNVDDSEIKNWIQRNSEERNNILNQNKEIQNAFNENDKQVDELRKRAADAKTDSEREQIKNEFAQLDNDFLYNQKLADAEKLLYAQKYNDALKIYKEAIEINPNNPTAYVKCGDICLSKGLLSSAYDIGKTAEKENKKLALEYYDKALKADPNYAETYSSLSRYYMVDSDSKKTRSLEYINKAISLNPNKASYYKQRGLIYNLVCILTKLHDTAIPQNYIISALEDFNKAVELEPNEFSYSARAKFYSDVEMYDRALDDINKALQMSENKNDNNMLSVCYLERAGIYKDLKNYPAAIADYNKSIELYPNSSDSVYSILGYLYQEMGDKTKADECFKKSKEIEKSMKAERTQNYK